MSQIITSFNPASKPADQFMNPLPGGVGTLVFYNDSGITIDAMWNGDGKVLPAGMIDIVNLCDPAQIIQWQQDYILTNVSSWPASVVKVVGYRPDEKLPYSAFPVPLQRTSNVGNTIPVGTSVATVVNDGNVAPTQVIEATPSGAPGSQLKWNNDGSGLFGGGLIVVNASGIFTAIPNNSIPAAAISGTVAAASSATTAGTLNGPISTYANGGANVDGISTETPAASARAILFQNWDGSAQHNVLTVGSAFMASSQFRDNGSLLMASSSFITGTSSGTVSHSFGATPNICLAIDTTTNSTMTVGYDTLGSSSVHINAGASHTWKALLI